MIRTFNGVEAIRNMTGLDVSGRVRTADIEMHICPEQLNAARQVIDTQWQYGRKYLRVCTTCKGTKIVPHILEMWEPVSRDSYAIFEPLSNATGVRLPPAFPTVINDLFYVMSHMPYLRNQIGSLCFVKNHKSDVPQLIFREIPNNTWSWCMFSPQYWSELRAYERRNWDAFKNFFDFKDLLYSFRNSKGLQWKSVEISFSKNRISKDRWVRFLGEHVQEGKSL